MPQPKQAPNSEPSAMEASMKSMNTFMPIMSAAIYDKSQELINQIQRLDNNLEETTNYIRHVLAVYKAKDEMLKAIMASQNMV